VIRAIVAFELLRRMKMLSTYVYAAVLFAAGFFMMLAAGGAFSSVAVSSGNERVVANSPQQLFGTISLVALLGLFTVGAIFGQAAYQDFGHNTWMLVFTKNVRKATYLVGRFLGAFVFSAVLFLAIGAGQLAGSLVLHFIRPDSIGPTSLAGYVWPYLVQVWPMLFFTGALFFSLAAITRRMAPVYVGTVVLVLGYVLATTLAQDVQNRTLAALLDPFGFFAFGIVTRYWTVAEQNHDLVPVVGLFGVNRALWTAMGAVLLPIAIHRFRTTVDEHRDKRTNDEERSDPATPFPAVVPDVRTLGWARASLGFALMHFREILRSAVFWALMTAALIFGSMIVLLSKDLFGTATLPVTYQVLDLTQAGFRLFSLIIVTFYAGELVFRERDVGMQDIVDATRAPTWVPYLAKIGALFLVCISLEIATGLVALFSQLVRGYFAIDLRLYVIELFVIDLTGITLAASLALVIQVLVNHKYLGHGVMVLYYVASTIFGAIGLEDPLFRFGSEPSTPYSDMNAYGHFLRPFAWFRIYWWGAALVLFVLGYVLFVRGREMRFRRRLGLGRKRLGPLPITVALLGVVAFVSAGGFIFYNTHVLNRFETAKDGERKRASYEKKYRAAQRDAPQASIVAADVTFDIFPEERRLVARGTYTLENKTSVPIARVMMNLPSPSQVNIRELRVGDQKTPTEVDGVHDVRIFDLQKPLAPTERIDLVYDFEFAPKGFAHKDPRTFVVANGTFANNGLLPTLGYDEHAELESDRDRKSYGLAPKERMAPRDDPKEVMHNYIRHDSDFISFAATVSTSEDQIAIAPGYLEKEWHEGGRRYFRYVMDQPILNFFSVLSARYAVKRDTYEGVALEIFHHPSHTVNLDRMMLGMKDALGYCTAAFGPYQHRQARILEFPRYQTFAQSFPNTIPYSEAIGFIARVRDDDPEDVDYPYYVTAHEIAHQWWAHQVVGANVRGATMTSETLAQYSALMVMQKKYGKDRMRRFLKFELDRYLRGRFTERKKELPLAQNENQGYIHYEKGSLVMYALQDYIGEDRVNRALKKVVDQWRFKGPPYATAKDVVDALREETPSEYAYLIDDLFETITLYDNRATSATATANAAGGFDVVVEVVAKKLRSDDAGHQTELDFEDLIDVGALDGQGNALIVEKQKIKNGTSQLRFSVPKRPATVGIDPLNKLIDRGSDDNVVAPRFR
jgi:ABC-2 type transport system permease protein